YEQRMAIRQANVDAYVSELRELAPKKTQPRFAELRTNDAATRAAAEEGKYANDVRWAILQEQDEKLRAVNGTYSKAIADIDKQPKNDEQQKRVAEDQKKAAKRDRDRQIVGLRAEYGRRLELV